MDGQPVPVPLRDRGVRLHCRGTVPFGGVGHIDAVCRLAHRLCEVALPRGAVLRLGIRLLRVERHIGDIFGAVFEGQMLGRIPGLFEAFRHHQRDRLPEIADLACGLRRGLARAPLRRSCGEPLVVDHRNHAGHRQHRVLVDPRDRALGEGSSDQHAFETIRDRVFGGIGCGAGYLAEPVRARERLADDPLHHVVEQIAGVGFVLFQMRAHSSVPVASASTAASVRRASGILKSFSP